MTFVWVFQGCLAGAACGGGGSGGGSGGAGATGGAVGGSTSGGKGGTGGTGGTSGAGGSGGSGAGGVGASSSGGSGGAVGECNVNADCEAKLPATNPAGCAEGKCDILLNACTFKAKDSDGDGHTAQACASIGGGSIQTGDDCDDADPTTYPGAPDLCDGKIHTCAATACLCKDGETKACGAANTCNPTAVETCAQGGWGTCIPAPKTTCVPNSITACTSCSTLTEFKSGTQICTAACDYAGAFCTPTGGKWEKNAADPIWTHECGYKYSQAPYPDGWHHWPTTTACWLQMGPNFKLARGRYRWTTKVTVMTTAVMGLSVWRNGAMVGPPDGPQPDTACMWSGGPCAPGEVSITNAEANASQVQSIDFGVPDDCGGTYELRARAWSSGGSRVALEYSSLTWLSTY